MKNIVKFLLLVLVTISLLIPLFIRPKISKKKEKINYKEIDTIQKKSDSVYIYRIGSN
jgi:competence protein ComGC